MLSGTINPRVQREEDRGPVESTQRLSHMTLVFSRTPQQRAALNRLLQELQDPSSPNYHKWLTPDEFGEHFGASAESLHRVSDWLRSEGFVVESTGRGRGWIFFSGTVAQVQKTFHTEIHRFQTGAKTHFASVSRPSVPTEFQRLIGSIRGLDDFHLEVPTHLAPMFTASDGTHALAPGDVARIYDIFPPASAGAGQTIAVVGASDIELADIRQFRSTFKLPPNDPQTLLAGDYPGIDSSGPLLEADADLEWAGAVAPSATILYAYATDVIVASQKVIDQSLAQILVFTYGICEPNISQSDANFVQDLAQQANAQGITWIAASGDAGAAACDQGFYPATQGLAVSFPASLPEVTAVGGTEFNEQASSWAGNSLNLSSVAGYLPEVAWNDTSAAFGLRASGGGASVLYAKPLWQTGQGVPDDGARDVPDLALTASPTHDPYLVFSSGKTYAAGGTSLSAPVFAGMLADAEQAKRGTGVASASFGNINPSLYRLAGRMDGSAVFHDITAGNNLVPCTIGTQDCANGSLGYTAGPGYDLVTGLGSLNVSYFANVVQLVTNTSLSVSATQVPEGTTVTLTATVRDYNGTVPAGSVAFLDNGSLISASGGTLDSSGTASATVLLPHGTHAIMAAYSAPCCLLTWSTSAPVTVVVLPAPPQPPALASPASNSTDVSVSTSLMWSKAPFATSYDVYFGTAPSPAFWGNVPETQCRPGALAPNTKYYWKVVARDEFGSTASPVWSFTTTGVVYTISTIAGSSVPGFSGDGVPAAKALLSGPAGVALDRNGNLYVAESGNGRIRMINAAGVLSTVAGGGTGGDGGLAAAAVLDNPVGIAIDHQGNLYISEAYTSHGISSIRKVSPAGIITTIAGGTTAGYSGDGGPAVNAKLNSPTGLAADSQGTLYIADTYNGCIREIAAGIISTVAGQCTRGGFTSGASIGDGGPATDANLEFPLGVAVDAAGNLYIADTGNCRIRKVSNGIITTVVGLTGGDQGCGGPEPVPFRPVRLTFDSTGNLYFTDGYSDGYGNLPAGRVVKFANGVPSVIAGGGTISPGDGGPGTSAYLNPGSLAVDSGGKIYLSDNYYRQGGVEIYSQRIRTLTLSPSYTPPVPSIASGGVLNGASFAPAPVAAGSIANVFGSFSFGSPAQASGAPLPTALSGVSIQFQSGAGINAPLFYASSGQVNIQVPWELAGQSSVPIRALLNGSAGPSQILQMSPFAPGIFAAGPVWAGQGAIVDSSNTLVNATNPTTAGGVIQIYCAGLGPVTNSPASGSAASSTTLSRTTTKPTVTVGGLPATVLFSGLAPGTIGEYQVNVQVPAGVTPGLVVPVVLSFGGAISNTVMIAVR
jgi:uncharacterized protein (TIGR03437 family)